MLLYLEISANKQTLADIDILQINLCFPAWKFYDRLNKPAILYLETVGVAD